MTLQATPNMETIRVQVHVLFYGRPNREGRQVSQEGPFDLGHLLMGGTTIWARSAQMGPDFTIRLKPDGANNHPVLALPSALI